MNMTTARCQHCRTDQSVEEPGAEWFDVEVTHARPGYRAIATGRTRKVFVCADCMAKDRASRDHDKARQDAVSAYLAECVEAGISPDPTRYADLWCAS